MHLWSADRLSGLQEENEELGREAAEGRCAGLERQLALAHGAVADMRRAYLELEDTAAQLDAEAEELQLQARHAPPGVGRLGVHAKIFCL